MDTQMCIQAGSRWAYVIEKTTKNVAAPLLCSVFNATQAPPGSACDGLCGFNTRTQRLAVPVEIWEHNRQRFIVLLC